MQSEVFSSVEQLEHLLDEADGAMTTLANASAYLNELLPEINWVGFYLLEQGELRLGPFQGKPACTRIVLGKGVCGTAMAENRTQRVADVHAFPGHIACSSQSRSEIVVPIYYNGEFFALLDIDSDRLGEFDESDAAGLELFAEKLAKSKYNA